MDRDVLNSLKIDRDAAQASAARRMRPILIGVMVVLVIAAAAVGFWLLRDAAVVVQTAVARAETTAGASANTSTVLNASGYVVPRRMATVSAKITGQLTDVYVEEGMPVEEGQILARLDNDIARARLALAESELQTAKRRVREVEVNLAQARRELNRIESLRERNLVSQAELDQAQAGVAALNAQLAVARSQVDSAEGNVNLSQQQLEQTIVRAPFDGVVTIKNAQPGEIVSPISAGGGFTRTGIATIVDMDSLEIEVDVNEAYINRVFEGQNVEAVLDAYPDWRIPAEVISIVPTAQRQSATVKVRIGFKELDPRILPEMGVQVWFLEEQPSFTQMRDESLVWIPAPALHKTGDKNWVFVIANGEAQRRAVEVASKRANEIAIRAGLSGGERVIVSSPQTLINGMAVTEEAS